MRAAAARTRELAQHASSGGEQRLVISLPFPCRLLRKVVGVQAVQPLDEVCVTLAAFERVSGAYRTHSARRTRLPARIVLQHIVKQLVSEALVRLSADSPKQRASKRVAARRCEHGECELGFDNKKTHAATDAPVMMRRSSPRRMRVAAARRCAARTSVPSGCATRGAGGAACTGAAALGGGMLTASETGAAGMDAGAGGAPNSAITPGMAASIPACMPGGVADRCLMLKMTTSASTGGES